MEHIAKIAGTLCISVMVMGILYEAGSFAATEKVIKFVITVYILVTVAAAVKGADFKPDSIIQNIDYHAYSNSQYLKQQIVADTEKQLEQLIVQRLEQKNICYNSVSVHILEQNGNITADSITVVCESGYTIQVMECIADIATEETQINIGE